MAQVRCCRTWQERGPTVHSRTSSLAPTSAPASSSRAAALAALPRAAWCLWVGGTRGGQGVRRGGKGELRAGHRKQRPPRVWGTHRGVWLNASRGSTSLPSPTRAVTMSSLPAAAAACSRDSLNCGGRVRVRTGKSTRAAQPRTACPAAVRSAVTAHVTQRGCPKHGPGWATTRVHLRSATPGKTVRPATRRTHRLLGLQRLAQLGLIHGAFRTAATHRWCCLLPSGQKDPRAGKSHKRT